VNRWLGAINHISITVSNLDDAMEFFEPWPDGLKFEVVHMPELAAHYG
jgi:hypothetical protein